MNTQFSGLETHFAPPGRASQERISAQTAQIQSDEVLRSMLEAMPGFGFILNPECQILAVNARLLETLGVIDPSSLIGMRPGEVVKCIHSTDGPAGCGTGETCSTCGAARAILESQQGGKSVVYECRICTEREKNSALDLEVVATPVRAKEGFFTVCSMRDISGEKRRRVLERLFFHDVLNTAGGVQGLAMLLLESDEENTQEDREIKQTLVEAATELIGEIRNQRDLAMAESGDLKVQPEQVPVKDLLVSVRGMLTSHKASSGRTLEVFSPTDLAVTSDLSLLRRVLVNLVKNALEAARQGETVTLRCEAQESQVVFVVHNPGVMPKSVQLQIFQRSFSTKGEVGRGIGTYSIKLFGERFLHGQVSFVSREPEGTTFTLTLPMEWPETG